MNFYLIVYEPRAAGAATGGDYTALSKALQKKPTWWSYLDRVWIIGTEENASVLWESLKGVFGKNDNVLIVEVAPDADRQGWLPEKAWKWFNTNLQKKEERQAGPSAGIFRHERVEIQGPKVAEATPEEQPPPPESGTLTCGFCGHEAPAEDWKGGDCPRCGIAR